MIRGSLALAVLASAAPAVGQSIDTGRQQIELAGVAPSACVIRPPTASSGVNASYQTTGVSTGEVRILEMADPQTAQARATAITIALPVVCNSAHVLTARSRNGGLQRLAANQRNNGAGGFTEFLPYSLNMNWAGQEVARTSNAGTPLAIVSNNGGAGNVSLGFSVPAGGAPLIAGTYSDSIVIEFRVAD
jgi:hypothetical protein